MFPMKIKTELESEEIVHLHVALNSCEFALARLSKLDKENFPEIFYRGHYENLAKAKKAVAALIQNS